MGEHTRRMYEDRALLDPGAVFGTPEALCASTELTTEQKIELLKRWAYDDSAAAVATEEGMPGHRTELQRRILLALAALGAEPDVEHVGPTKQHGLSS